MSEEKVTTIDPIDVLGEMTEEEFIKYAKMGFNFVMFDNDKKELKKGDFININGDYFKISGTMEDIVGEFEKIETENLKKFLMNEFAKIGVTLIFISLGRKGMVAKLDEDSKPLSDRKMQKQLEKEMKVLKNTAVILKRIATDHSEKLELNPKAKATIQ